MRTLTRYVAAATLAGAFAIGATGTGIASPQTSAAGIKAAPEATTDISAQRRRHVQRRVHRRHYGPGPAVAGAALGIIGAGIAAATAPRYYYYDAPYAPHGYYGGPAYGYDPYW